MQLFAKILSVGLATRPLSPVHDEAIHLVRTIDARSRRLFGRALAIREVDAGSCNGCEIEIGGLAGPVYDMERFGLHFVASPRHADLLLVTGPVTVNMAAPLRKTWEATPAPRLVVGAGVCARTCGVFAGSYAIAGSVDRFVPVDAWVDGCPPEPTDILRGILAALDRLPSGEPRDDERGARPARGLRRFWRRGASAGGGSR
jgi:Ni,Fe-hydrogenase III small subunit